MIEAFTTMSCIRIIILLGGAFVSTFWYAWLNGLASDSIFTFLKTKALFLPQKIEISQMDLLKKSIICFTYML